MDPELKEKFLNTLREKVEEPYQQVLDRSLQQNLLERIAFFGDRVVETLNSKNLMPIIKFLEFKLYEDVADVYCIHYERGVWVHGSKIVAVIWGAGLNPDLGYHTRNKWLDPLALRIYLQLKGLQVDNPLVGQEVLPEDAAELVDCLSAKLEPDKGVDYRPSEFIPEDYYA